MLLSRGLWPEVDGCLLEFCSAQDASQTPAATTANSRCCDSAKCLLQTETRNMDWYKAQNCPSNSENITIFNNSPTDVKVQFSFENAGELQTFLLHPPRMTLKPKEKQELTVCAYPTCPGFLEDKLICCIEKNPNPVVFSLCCHGVDMKLEVSPLELSFDKLLLHRTDCRTLVLKNNSMLPMAWQLRGLDDLVENFSLSQNNGTIDPHAEFEVTLHFKAEQIGSIEKTLRLEVSDTKNILGIVQAENIEISAEVYDVSLSIDMPEGADGSLEFGTINVMDKVKKVLSLKNKAIYKTEYRFMLKGAGPRMQDLASYFTVTPQSGMMNASHPDATVEILFHPTSEILLKNKPVLYCQVIDAISGEGGQAVTNIPIRVSAKAEYSKYSLVPASPTDFGAMIKGTKKSRTVVLKNNGTLSFNFRIRQAPKLASALESKSLGMFTVFPCSGSVCPSGMQLIRVECLAGQEGTCEEQIYIDIMDRDPTDNPLGIPYTLIVETCLPGLVENVASIFKEYPICSSANLDRKLQSVKGTGLFVRDENRFIFNKVQVGQEAEAHFSICNACRLPCDVVLSIKPLPGEEQSSINNIFKLDPVKMSLRGSSSAVTTVTFIPPDKQSYDCTIEASLAIPKGSYTDLLRFIAEGNRRADGLAAPAQMAPLPDQQDSEQPLQQPKQHDCSKNLRHSDNVGSSPEIFPDAIGDLSVFSIKPYCDTIYPGQKQAFQVWFSPKCAGMFQTTLQCRIPNLKPTQKTGQVIVKAWEQKSLGKPLEQTEEGQGAKKQVLWKPAPKGQHLRQLEPPAGASNIMPSAADGLPPFTRDLCSPHLLAHTKSGCPLSAPRPVWVAAEQGCPTPRDRKAALCGC
ncbi:unnamed protein product [Coccothraustes coccothraustes]